MFLPRPNPSPQEQQASPSEVNASLARVLSYAGAQRYQGYDKFDALNSPFLEKSCGRSWLLRLVTTQIVNRSWINLRPVLRVQVARNPKGIGNFIRAYCNLYAVAPLQEYLRVATELGDWLLSNTAERRGVYSGVCWGYQFPWQSPGFFAPRHYPNLIVTVFAAEALLQVGVLTNERRFIDAAAASSRFLLMDLPQLEADEERLCIGYVPSPVRWKVININAVAAGFLIKLWRSIGDPELKSAAARLIRWVIEQRTEYDAWHYTVPGSDSRIGHDNYHTGGILDGILDYMEISGDWSYKEVYCRALDFYRTKLFSTAGEPYLTSVKKYPFDIHGAAQGIITFAKASAYFPGTLAFANCIANWAVREMQGSDGGFFYRKHRFFVWKLPLMRWNNSWMSLALSELARRSESR